jgi:hypothetical protein
LINKLTGRSRPALDHGFRDLSRSESPFEKDRIRKAGAGRKKATASYPDLLTALESPVEPLSRGDPESPLRWTV